MSRDYTNKITLRPPPGSTPFPVGPIDIILVATDSNGVVSGSPGDVAFLAGGLTQWRCAGGMVWIPLGGAGISNHSLLTPASLVGIASGHTGTPGSVWVFDGLGNSDEVIGVDGQILLRSGGVWTAAAPPTGGSVEVPFTFASGTLVLTPLLIGNLITPCYVRITTPWNLAGASIKVGTPSTPSALLAVTDADPYRTGRYDAQLDFTASVAENLQVVVAGPSTAGAGYVVFNVS